MNDDVTRQASDQAARIEIGVQLQHLNQSLMQVRAGLLDVKKTLHSGAARFDARMTEAGAVQQAAAKSQNRLMGATVILTLAIAIATGFYTWITWLSVEAQREANEIQQAALIEEGNS
jgi:hypothetical protein